MTFKRYLTRTRAEVEPAVRRLLAKPVWSKHRQLRPGYAAFSASVFGGKMLRAALVCLGYELAGGRQRTKIVPVAAAFELMHTSLLIHDDLIDQSVLRRGQPSLHLRLSVGEKGRSQALCYGDLGIVLAIEALANARFSPHRRHQATEFFLKAIAQTIAGQVLDVTVSFDTSASLARVLQIQEWKTAEYSVVAPLSVGAILAGARPEQLQAIRDFGRKLGIAFQVQDDILGTFGQEAVIGKSTVSDAQEGKNTVLIAHAWQAARPKQKARLRALYGAKPLRPKQAAELREIFVTTGALSAAQALAKRYINAARRCIPQLTANLSLQQLIRECVELVADRQR